MVKSGTRTAVVSAPQRAAATARPAAAPEAAPRIQRRRLSFRCRRCRRVSLAVAEWRGPQATTVECAHCGESYLMSAEKYRGKSDAHYAERIRELAASRGLDVATATSVHEGFIPLEVVLEWSQAPAAVPVPETTPKTRRGLIGFIAAAIAGLCILLAARPGAEVPAPEVVAAPVARVADEVPSEAPAPAPRASPVVSWRNEFGRLTEVSGPDPKSVLAYFCSDRGEFRPLEVKASTPPHPGLRLGMVRSVYEPDRRLALWIRKDSRTGMWYVGDRRVPIEPQEPPGGEQASTRAGG